MRSSSLIVACSWLVASVGCGGEGGGRTSAELVEQQLPFAPATQIQTGSAPDAVAIGDVTGDGLNDVVLTTTRYFDPDNDYQVLVFPQLDDGTLGAPTKVPYQATANRTGLALVELDGNAPLEIVVGHRNGITVLSANGQGGFASQLVGAARSADTLAALDVNLDGHLDVVGLSWSSGATVFIGDGQASFSSQYHLPTNAAGYNDQEVGDLNGDGILDLVVMSGQSYATPNLSVHLHDGAGSLQAPETYFVGTNEITDGVGLGDVNGDGLTDVVLSRGRNQPTHLWVFTQTSEGTLAGPSMVDSHDMPGAVVVEDVDLDGRDDVLVLHDGWGRLGVYIQDAQGVLGAEQLMPLPYISRYSPQGLAVGDIDADGCPDVAIADSSNGLVTLRGQSCVRTPRLIRGVVWGAGSEWVTVELPQRYDSMVVVATPSYEADSAPAVVRVRNAQDSSFELKVTPAGGAAPTAVDVHYVVVEEGVYTAAEHGVTMEAVKYLSTITDRAGSWQAEARAYAQDYARPVVIGQVMSYNDPGFSVFWSRGSKRQNPPSATALRVGKTVCEDPDRSRADELVGYIVIEAGGGTIDGVRYAADVGHDSVRGMHNAPPFGYALDEPPSPLVGVAAVTGMDGGNGGWAVLYSNHAVSGSGLGLAVEEDVARDAERRHTSEQVAYIVME